MALLRHHFGGSLDRGVIQFYLNSSRELACSSDRLQIPQRQRPHLVGLCCVSDS